MICRMHWPRWPAVHGAVSNAPATAAKYVTREPLGKASKSSRYGNGNSPDGGAEVAPLACPVVVVSEYRNPGWKVNVRLPPLGVISVCCRNQLLRSFERRLLAHTCTVPVDNPP